MIENALFLIVSELFYWSDGIARVVATVQCHAASLSSHNTALNTLASLANQSARIL